jgi:iron complex outermembrane receptor protein
VTYNRSENDYEYIDDRFKDENDNTLKNLNGNYENLGLNLSFGYKFSNMSKLYFYSNYYTGERLFSAGLPNPSAGKEKNVDKSFRNLLQWRLITNGYKHSFNSAFLTQDYTYFADLAFRASSFGKSVNGVFNYNIHKRFSKSLAVEGKLGYDIVEVKTNAISSKQRENTYQVIDVKYTPMGNLKTSLGIRHETSSFYKLPVTYALGIEYGISKYFRLKGNYSTNFRQPTVNELFWPIVGDASLRPETTKQYDLGISFKHKYLEISSNYFSIDLKDKILWLPVGGSNLWRPKNVDTVLNRGLEFGINSVVRLNDIQFLIHGNYTIVDSENKATGKKIPFVPRYALNYSLTTTYKIFEIFFQQLYQSKVYTTEDQIDFYSLDSFSISNTGFNVTIINKANNTITIGGAVNNIFNKVYYFTNLRPMPGRNYNLNINYKF